MALGQYHRKKILVKNFAPGIGARHGHEFLGPVQAHGIMSQCTKMAEVPTGSTTQIKDGVRRIALNRVQERCVVLADIVRSEEHTSELQSLMRISYAVFCLK